MRRKKRFKSFETGELLINVCWHFFCAVDRRSASDERNKKSFLAASSSAAAKALKAPRVNEKRD
jgi:hypothetical protein